MRTFLITHKKSKSTMLFKYSLKGVLTEFKLNFKPIAKFYELLEPPLPLDLNKVDKFKESQDYTVKQIDQDFSFKSFWDTFSYKHGNKKRAADLWKLLSEVEKAKAIAYIPTYKSMVISSGKQHLYPETYLFQKRFDNE
ncbi:hypothetical protein PL373_16075 [Tenacibaculum maritimum]|nr:hypothetical protein [Tenacibaculum maritimum]MDB0602619.1 hypothetical protein [Tenacibaculum maritimum]MDB0611269.1 hypothetical protein [Tenacibaculum maritimum]